MGRLRVDQKIGFIGRADINAREAEILFKLGQAIARLGHTLVTVPAEGATAQVREGVMVEKGKVLDIQTGVLDIADHTLLYPTPTLLTKLENRYPEFRKQYKVTILQPHQLDLFWTSMKTIMREEGISVPT